MRGGLRWRLCFWFLLSAMCLSGGYCFLGVIGGGDHLYTLLFTTTLIYYPLIYTYRHHL